MILFSIQGHVIYQRLHFTGRGAHEFWTVCFHIGRLSVVGKYERMIYTLYEVLGFQTMW